MKDTFLETEIVARLEGKSVAAIQKRIQRGSYPGWALKKEARESGGYKFLVSTAALSDEAQAVYNRESSSLISSPEPAIDETAKRKTRSDAGTTSANENLLLRCAAMINSLRASSSKRLHRSYGYKQAYETVFIPGSEEDGTKVISYRHFINLVSPFVDKEIQLRVNLGPVKYKQQRTLKHRHDYSIYEPMEFLQEDHTQFDCLCIHNGKLLRPWASITNSLGDRMLSYPTIVDRPDSYSIANDLINFVMRYGLSQRPVRYYADNGKSQKSRLMTKNEVKEVEIPAYGLDEQHIQAMQLMGIGFDSDKGLLQNLGLIEGHAEARMPHQKLIERNFGIGGTMEWFKDRPEYTGRKYEESPDKLARMIKSGNIWTSEEMVEYVINKIDEYNNRTHQGIKIERAGTFAVPHTYGLKLDYFQTNKRVLQVLKGMIPQSMSEVYRIFNDPVFAKDELETNIYSPNWTRRIHQLCGWNTRALPSRERLAMLAMKSETRIMHPYGFTIKNLPYISYQLQPYIGKSIVIRYSADNIIRIKEESGKENIYIREVYCFIKQKEVINGKVEFVEKFICIAEPHPRTVKGTYLHGKARTFIDERNSHLKEVTTAARICSDYSDEKEAVSDIGTPIHQLNHFRNKAGKEMAEAIETKKKQEKVKKLVNKNLENNLSSIYGTRVQVDE